jgi:hypothetical protein
MKPTIAALFGVIAMACASDYSSMRQLVARHSFLLLSRTMSRSSKAESFKNEVALNVQEISSGLPLLSMTGNLFR